MTTILFIYIRVVAATDVIIKILYYITTINIYCIVCGLEDRVIVESSIAMIAIICCGMNCCCFMPNM